ncbi:MAG TPA: TauD/TfdA family dioxygenase [Mycobacteriales bacterium]
MTGTTRIAEYTMSSQEIDGLQERLLQLSSDHESPLNPEFYDRQWYSHTLLPDGLSRFLEDFRRHEPAAACVIHGFPVDDEVVGPTPDHWNRPTSLFGATAESDYFMALCAFALGEPFAWSTLQHGRMIQDVFPIRGDEQRLNGHGSEAFLVFHTDDAFHPDSCDYLLLFGVRNHDAVPTLISSVRDLSLSHHERRLLSGNRFHIVPDDEHIRQLASSAPGHPALRRAIRMRDQPTPVPVLFGAASNPYLRLDGPYMRCIGGEEETEAALKTLHAELDRVRLSVVVGQGSLLIIDNKVAAHARASFTARYEGTDRWLRKIIVSRGLRKWSDSKAEPGSRLVL